MRPFSSVSKHAVMLGKVFLLLFLPNLSFFLLSNYLSVGRPWVNLDYSLLFVLFAFGYVRITVILTPLFILFDLFAIFVQVFPFIRISDALYLISMLPYVSSMYMAGFVLLLLFFFAKTYIFVRARKFFCRKTALISLNLVLFTHFLLGYVVFPDAFRNHRVLGEDI